VIINERFIKSCPYCGSGVRLGSHVEIYKKSFGWEPTWICKRFPDCDAFVGTHKGTNDPLGRLANGKLRLAKRLAHRAFDAIWKNGLKKRGSCYAWLAERMEIDIIDCHIGMFDPLQCYQVVSIIHNQGIPYYTEKYDQKVKENHLGDQNLQAFVSEAKACYALLPTDYKAIEQEAA